MKKIAAILLSFLSAMTVMAQNDGLENITTEIKETITEPQYDFAPDENSPNVEVAPLAVNAKDKDVPLKPTITESVKITTDAENLNNED